MAGLWHAWLAHRVSLPRLASGLVTKNVSAETFLDSCLKTFRPERFLSSSATAGKMNRMTATTDATSPLRLDLEAVSRALQALHKQILEAEGAYLPGRSSLELLDRLLNDPNWAWLRALSQLITDLDEQLAGSEEMTSSLAGAAAGRVRALVFGLGEPRDEQFLNRYRPLLQESAALASAHGELKRRVDALKAHLS
jgi:hypothetical protein